MIGASPPLSAWLRLRPKLHGCAACGRKRYVGGQRRGDSFFYGLRTWGRMGICDGYGFPEVDHCAYLRLLGRPEVG